MSIGIVILIQSFLGVKVLLTWRTLNITSLIPVKVMKTELETTWYIVSVQTCNMVIITYHKAHSHVRCGKMRFPWVDWSHRLCSGHGCSGWISICHSNSGNCYTNAGWANLQHIRVPDQWRNRRGQGGQSAPRLSSGKFLVTNWGKWGKEKRYKHGKCWGKWEKKEKRRMKISKNWKK